MRRGSTTTKPLPSLIASAFGRRAQNFESLWAVFGRNDTLFLTLIFLWLLAALCGEIVVFHDAAVQCRDKLGLAASPPPQATQLSNVSRVLFVSDPQLTSTYSYPYMQYKLLNKIASFYSDLFMKRAYTAIQSALQPEVVFFTGDLFDGVTKTLNQLGRYFPSGLPCFCSTSLLCNT